MPQKKRNNKVKFKPKAVIKSKENSKKIEEHLAPGAINLAQSEIAYDKYLANLNENAVPLNNFSDPAEQQKFWQLFDLNVSLSITLSGSPKDDASLAAASQLAKNLAEPSKYIAFASIQNLKTYLVKLLKLTFYFPEHQHFFYERIFTVFKEANFIEHDSEYSLKLLDQLMDADSKIFSNSAIFLKTHVLLKHKIELTKPFIHEQFLRDDLSSFVKIKLALLLLDNFVQQNNLEQQDDSNDKYTISIDLAIMALYLNDTLAQLENNYSLLFIIFHMLANNRALLLEFAAAVNTSKNTAKDPEFLLHSYAVRWMEIFLHVGAPLDFRTPDPLSGISVFAPNYYPSYNLIFTSLLNAHQELELNSSALRKLLEILPAGVINIETLDSQLDELDIAALNKQLSNLSFEKKAEIIDKLESALRDNLIEEELGGRVILKATQQKEAGQFFSTKSKRPRRNLTCLNKQLKNLADLAASFFQDQFKNDDVKISAAKHDIWRNRFHLYVQDRYRATQSQASKEAQPLPWNQPTQLQLQPGSSTFFGAKVHEQAREKGQKCR